MSEKFDKFVTALNALCKEHGVFLSTTGYDALAVFDADEHDEGTEVDRIEDETQ